MIRAYPFSEDTDDAGSPADDAGPKGDAEAAGYAFDGFNVEFSKRTALLPPAPPDGAKREEAKP